jgi:thiol-disulfide isomerase/thioredoxin
MIPGVTEPAFVLAPLACLVVLVVSGVAKYGDTEGTRSAFAAMRVPKVLSRTQVVRALPIVEIVLGVLLLVTWGWPLAAVAVVVTALFAAYWVLVLLVLRRGDEVDCGCFGAAGDDRVTAATLARNSMLVVFGALATAFGAGGSGVVPTLRDLSRGDLLWLLMAAGVAGTAVLMVGYRPGDADRVRAEELLDYERRPIPFALLRDAQGDTTTLRRLASGRAQLLVFMSSYCGVCHEVAAKLPEWSARLGPVEVQAVFTESLADLPDDVTAPGIKTWYDVERGATETFVTAGRPAAVLLGADGALAGGPVSGGRDVAEFVDDIVAELAAGTVTADPEP